MEKKPIREIISVIFKAVTLAMGVAVVVVPAWEVSNRKTPSHCLVSAWPARAPLCWRNSDGTSASGSLPMQAYQCPRHGDCAACREYDLASGRKPLTRCEKLERKEQRKVERKKQKTNRLCYLFLIFLTGCLVGWVYEEIFYWITEEMLRNRGILYIVFSFDANVEKIFLTVTADGRIFVEKDYEG